MIPMTISPNDLLVIAILAVLLFGPEKLPELIKKTARVIKFLRGVANSATETLKTELGPELAELVPDEIKLSDLRQPQRMLLRTVFSDVQQDLDSIRTQIAGLQQELAGAVDPVAESLRGKLADIEQAVDKTTDAVGGAAESVSD